MKKKIEKIVEMKNRNKQNKNKGKKNMKKRQRRNMEENINSKDENTKRQNKEKKKKKKTKNGKIITVSTPQHQMAACVSLSGQGHLFSVLTLPKLTICLH